MGECTLRSGALQRLGDRWHGELISPDDQGYDAACSVWNGLIDRYPALIAYCADEADVAQALQVARSQHLPVAVRSGYCDLGTRAFLLGCAAGVLGSSGP
jgi:FAD/FMN-containing dehydrogenase